MVPKGWRSCSTLGTAAPEKHTEVTVDKEYTVQCADRGTLLEDIKGTSILGTGRFTSPTRHG